MNIQFLGISNLLLQFNYYLINSLLKFFIIAHVRYTLLVLI